MRQGNILKAVSEDANLYNPPIILLSSYTSRA